MTDIKNTQLSDNNGRNRSDTQSDYFLKNKSQNSQNDNKLTNGSYFNISKETNKGIRLDFSLDKYKKTKKNSEEIKPNNFQRGVSSGEKKASKNIFNPLKKIEDLFAQKEERKVDYDFRKTKQNLNLEKENFKDIRNMSYNSHLNKSRDMSLTLNSNLNTSVNLNLSMSKTNSSKMRDVSISNSNSRLKKEIENFSKSLNDGRDTRQNGFINRPPITLNKPELEINTKEYFNFSPIKTRQNFMVTGNLLRNYTKNNNYNLFNKLNGMPTTTINKKLESFSNMNLFSQTQNFNKNDSFNSYKNISTLNQSKLNQEKKSVVQSRLNTIQQVEYTHNDSVEDFLKDFDNSQHNFKDSFVMKLQSNNKKKHLNS